MGLTPNHTLKASLQFNSYRVHLGSWDGHELSIFGSNENQLSHGF